MTISPIHAQNQLASQIATVLNQAIQGNRSYVETLAEQNVKDGEATGFVDLNGSGETTLTINFPLRFLEKPVFTAGLELGPNVALAWGDFPLWSATVASWVTESMAGTTIYTGAVLGVLAIARRSILHYRFTGRIFTLPANAEPTMDSGL